MNKAKPIYVILMGGLGNQLFQVAAALSIAKERPIYIDWKTASPRLNGDGIPDIASFRLPSNIVFLDNSDPNLILRKSFGFLLRTGINDGSFQRRKILIVILRFVGSILFSLRYRATIYVEICQGLGFSSLSDGRLSRVLIGYFQSYIWTETQSILENLKSIRSREFDIQFLKLKKDSDSEKPLVVHLRFGDYKHEPKFGLLSRQYYLESINMALSKQEFCAIWVFSDDIESARNVINFETSLPVRFIENIGDSTSTNFDAMRLGHGYVIANSSFSWWAARLSFSDPKIVVAPEPWFIGLKDIPCLIPPSWHRLKGHY